MNGTDATTGKPLADAAHLAQSIGDILSTPLGTRVMRRDYGSLLPQLVDQPVNGTTLVKLYAATASALMRWEPRLRIGRVSLARGDAGAFVLTVEGQRTDVAVATSTALTVPLSLQAA